MSVLLKLKIVQALEEAVWKHGSLAKTETSESTKNMYAESTVGFKQALAAYFKENPEVKLG